MTVQSQVLIVSNEGDVPADRVEARLADEGVGVFRLNLDEFPSHFEVDLRFARRGWEGELVHVPSGRVFDPNAVRSVWVRKPAAFTFGQRLGAQELAFATEECHHLLLGLLHALPTTRWMNHPTAARAANWKVEQQARAHRMGFRVADVLITNRPSAARAFAQRDVIFKTLSSCDLAAERVAMEDRVVSGLKTTRIGDAHHEALESVRVLPTFFQDHVAKRSELRVTVIGGRAWAARIFSQVDARTQVDFRDFAAAIPFEHAELSPALERRCVEFVHSYGLSYGALDLLEPADGGAPVFLENNPTGQFLFVEELVPSLELTREVAAWLSRAAPEVAHVA